MSMIDHTTEYPHVKVGEIEDLLRMHMALRQTHGTGGGHIALWGQPGLGKTQVPMWLAAQAFA